MTVPFKKMIRLLGVTLSFGLLAHCGAPDTYQGNGVWLKSDGTTYRGPAPVSVSRVETLGSPRVTERIRETEDKSTNAQGQVVIRKKEEVTMEMNFQLLVTLSNGEQQQMSFSVSGERNSSRYTSASVTGSNGYSYRASGQVRLSQFNPTFKLTIRSKGLPDWIGTVSLR